VDADNVGRRFGYVAALGILCLVNTAALQQVLWNGSRCGMRAKIGLVRARARSPSARPRLGQTLDCCVRALRRPLPPRVADPPPAPSPLASAHLSHAQLCALASFLPNPIPVPRRG
jgi:hypothetical protein